MRLQHGFDHVVRLEQRIHHGGGELQLLLAQPVEERLRDVGEIRHVGKPERARPALDGMRRPEDRVEVFQTRLDEIEPQQDLLDGRDVLLGFVEEDLRELPHVEAHDFRLPGVSR